MRPFFTTFYTQWPPVVAFSVKIFQRDQKCVRIAWILCNFMPNDPLFSICHLMSQMTHPFLQENCHWWSLDLMHQYEHLCHFCMLVLPQEGGTVFPNNMEVSSLIVYTGWKNVYFPGSKPNFPQFELCFYVQKGKISPKIPKIPSTYQYFLGMSFPNSPFFLTMIVYITTKGPDLKSSLRVSSQISSKHTYLLVPSGKFPLNNRANLYFEVKIPDWCYNL